MRTAGIIAEYNPFHNGHMRHIALTKEQCDNVVVVMNGSFSQRGEPALIDKWTRARMALEHGADIVVELPVSFGMASAQRFACGGVEILEALHTDILSFGCETDDTDLLRRAADLLREESPAYRDRLKKGLEKGESFARARGEALMEMLPGAEVLMQPNAALALEYLQANRHMEIFAVKRNAPHNMPVTAEVTGAGAIREAVYEGRWEDAALGLPPRSYEALKTVSGSIPDRDALDRLTLYALRNMSLEAMRQLPDVEEGLENRLYKYCRTFTDLKSMLMACKCKRYTYARLSRIAAAALLGLTKDDMQSAPAYIRVLGVRKEKTDLLAHLHSVSTLPVVARTTQIAKQLQFIQERRATDIRALLSKEAAMRIADRDMTERLIVI